MIHTSNCNLSLHCMLLYHSNLQGSWGVQAPTLATPNLPTCPHPPHLTNTHTHTSSTAPLHRSSIMGQVGMSLALQQQEGKEGPPRALGTA
jgi:hypothetical protein